MARPPFGWLIIAGLLTACGQGQPDATADAAIHFNIAGMHCDGCANRIEHEIKQVDGVVAAEVSFVSGQVGPAEINYQSDRITAAAINESLSGLGQYRVTKAEPADTGAATTTEETDAASP